MLRFILSALASATLALSASAQSPSVSTQKPSVLAEVFVSQNCVNCPRAMSQMAARDDADSDLFVLSWSVNYWNYLGWTDTLAQAEFGKRQKDYARILGVRGAYTPMLVVNGRAQTAANKASGVDMLLGETQGGLSGLTGLAPTAKLNVKVKGAGTEGGYAVSVSGEGLGPVRFTLARYLPGDTVVTPQRGPNRKVSMPHRNSVQEAVEAGEFAGTGRTTLDVTCAGTCALIASDVATGAVVWFTPDLAAG
jgi:hypothetical protein